jgi:hypothetical protein
MNIPLPSDAPMPQSIDLSAMQKWLDQAQPKPRDASQDGKDAFDRWLLGVAQGAAQGGDFGAMLLNMGMGGLAGQIDARDRAKTEQQKNEELMRAYAMDRAGTELDISKMNVEQQNQLSEVIYRNNLSKYQVGLKNMELQQPQVLSSSGGLIQVSIRNPQTGQREIQVIDGGVSMKQHRTGMMLGEEKDFFGREQGDLLAVESGALDVASRVASQLMDKGVAGQVLDATDIDKINEELAKFGDLGNKRDETQQRLVETAVYEKVLSGAVPLELLAPYSSLAAKLYATTAGGM